MKKDLTNRQQQFLSQFLDLYHEIEKPIPYATVAKRLGIGNVTAFEMLRLLEERGLIHSEYQVKSDQHGPGRAPVFFYPTGAADRLIEQIAGEETDLQDWWIVKERILKQLRDGKAAGEEELLNNLIQRIPENNSPIIFMTEMISAVVLALYQLKDSPGTFEILTRLQKIGLPEGFSLGVLSGITILLSTIERTNLRFSTALINQVNRYEATLTRLSNENRSMLSEFAREAVSILVS